MAFPIALHASKCGTSRSGKPTVNTDDKHLPIYEAIKNLPRLDAVSKYTQIRAQILGGTGQNGTQAVAKVETLESSKALENKGVSRGLTVSVVDRQMERAKGFEPSTLTLAT
jgi:hypothetical protein